MRRVYRLFGIPVLSIESDDEPTEVDLTAADNGGGTYSDRVDVPPGFAQPQWNIAWEEDRK